MSLHVARLSILAIAAVMPSCMEQHPDFVEARSTDAQSGGGSATSTTATGAGASTASSGNTGATSGGSGGANASGGTGDRGSMSDTTVALGSTGDSGGTTTALTSTGGMSSATTAGTSTTAGTTTAGTTSTAGTSSSTGATGGTGGGNNPPGPPLTTPGYTARACGFDLDDDGLVGELMDDCNVCDGVTTDPDGDGVDEDQIYIDCNAGTDLPQCGTPGTPCATIAYAWANQANGPGDGAEDILCFRGVCAEESLAPAVNGLAATRVEPASGNQAQGFTIATDPAMLVGWDADDDGEYPPFDTDDIAVLDGSMLNGTAFVFPNTGTYAYLEFAHFSARDYGRSFWGTGNFMIFSNNAGRYSDVEYFGIHDLELTGIRQDHMTSSESVFNAGTARALRHFWVHNLSALDTGGGLLRVSGESTTIHGPIRLDGVHVSAHGCDATSCGNSASVWFVRLIKWAEDVEVINSVFDGNEDAWEPYVAGGPTGTLGVNVQGCTQGVWVRNNLFERVRVALWARSEDNGSCQPAVATRPLRDVHFDGNIISAERGAWDNGANVFQVEFESTSADLDMALSDATAINNRYRGTGSLPGFVSADVGNDQGPHPGAIVIANNSVTATTVTGHARIAQRGVHPLQQYVIANNAFSNDGGLTVELEFLPSSLTLDHNRYDPASTFRLGATSYSALSNWRGATSAEASSGVCVPSYVSPADDLHLMGTDMCAVDQGLDMSPWFTNDCDGEARPSGAWDIGADEL